MCLGACVFIDWLDCDFGLGLVSLFAGLLCRTMGLGCFAFGGVVLYVACGVFCLILRGYASEFWVARVDVTSVVIVFVGCLCGVFGLTCVVSFVFMLLGLFGG